MRSNKALYILILATTFWLANAHPGLLINEVFADSARHHRTYLAIKASIPNAQRRLSNWMHRAYGEAEVLQHSTHPKIARWRQQLAKVSQLANQPRLNEFGLIKSVNALVNRDVKYLSDWKHGGRDFWEGPAETLVEGGDCEDYALLKATSLMHLGWPGKRMHLVAGVLPGGIGHMMLAIELKNGQRWLLDNRTSRVHRWPFDFWTPVYEVGGHKGAIRFIELKARKKSK